MSVDGSVLSNVTLLSLVTMFIDDEKCVIPPSKMVIVKASFWISISLALFLLSQTACVNSS